MGIGTTLIVAAVVVVPGDVVEFERAADEWLTAAENGEAWAFDEFFPSSGEQGCNVDPPNGPANLWLDGVTMTVSAFDANGQPACPISDERSFSFASDGRLSGGGDARLVFEFDGWIRGFYTFYGSLPVDERVTMRLYQGEVFIAELTGPLSDDGVGAVGHGFVSDDPVNRLELTTSESGLTMIGAFAYLAEGEPSLGTVFIPAYGFEAERDFAVAFTTPPILGACCLSLGECGILTQSSCERRDGVWRGEGTDCSDDDSNGTADVCDPLTGACCRPNGTCTRYLEHGCVDAGGLWQGPETTCADFNGNGIADVCERIGVCRSDSNGDGVVDFVDLLTLLQDWGPCPE